MFAGQGVLIRFSTAEYSMFLYLDQSISDVEVYLALAWCRRRALFGCSLLHSKFCFCRGGGGGGGTPRKIGWGCAARFSEPLPCLWPKSAIFPTLFMTWPKIRNPIYDHTLASKSCFKLALSLVPQFRQMLNYRKQNLWWAFVDFLFHNDEKVASS